MSNTKSQKRSSVFELASEWAYNDLSILRGVLEKRSSTGAIKPAAKKKVVLHRRRKELSK